MTDAASQPAAAVPIEVRIVSGGVPTAEQEAVLAIAVSRFIAQRDARRAIAPPLWGVVGRLEARDSLAVRSRAMLPRDTTWTPTVHGPES